MTRTRSGPEKFLNSFCHFLLFLFLQMAGVSPPPSSPVSDLYDTPVDDDLVDRCDNCYSPSDRKCLLCHKTFCIIHLPSCSICHSRMCQSCNLGHRRSCSTCESLAACTVARECMDCVAAHELEMRLMIQDEQRD